MKEGIIWGPAKSSTLAPLPLSPQALTSFLWQQRLNLGNASNLLVSMVSSGLIRGMERGKFPRSRIFSGARNRNFNERRDNFRARKMFTICSSCLGLSLKRKLIFPLYYSSLYFYFPLYDFCRECILSLVCNFLLFLLCPCSSVLWLSFVVALYAIIFWLWSWFEVNGIVLSVGFAGVLLLWIPCIGIYRLFQLS